MTLTRFLTAAFSVCAAVALVAQAPQTPAQPPATQPPASQPPATQQPDQIRTAIAGAFLPETV